MLPGAVNTAVVLPRSSLLVLRSSKTVKVLSLS
jgi:hypothetical protein